MDRRSRRDQGGAPTGEAWPEVQLARRGLQGQAPAARGWGILLYWGQWEGNGVHRRLIRKRFSRTFQSCCRLPHLKTRGAGGQGSRRTAGLLCREDRHYSERGWVRGVRTRLPPPLPPPLARPYLAVGFPSRALRQLEQRQMPPRMASREALQPK